MQTEVFQGILIPFLGTTLGSACVLFMKNRLNQMVQRALTGFAAGFVVPLLPYLLSFAAGAMVYVVVEELIPEMSEGKHSNVGTVLFAAGFTVMMALDVALG